MNEVREALSRFRYALGPDGAVDLGDTSFTKPQAEGVRSSGTLVLEDPSPAHEDLPDGGAMDLETAPWTDASPVEPPTATLPLKEQPTQSWVDSRHSSQEPKTSKLWALALVGLIMGALGWISFQGESRMARDKLAEHSEPASLASNAIKGSSSAMRMVSSGVTSGWNTRA